MIVDAFFTYLIEKFYNKNAVRVVVLLFNSFINDTTEFGKVACILHGSFSPRTMLVLPGAGQLLTVTPCPAGSPGCPAATSRTPGHPPLHEGRRLLGLLSLYRLSACDAP